MIKIITYYIRERSIENLRSIQRLGDNLNALRLINLMISIIQMMTIIIEMVWFGDDGDNLFHFPRADVAGKDLKGGLGDLLDKVIVIITTNH